MKIAYPAVFTNENGIYSINFPDLPGCYSWGYQNRIDAVNAAGDLLAVWLNNMKFNKIPLPVPKIPHNIQVTDTVSFSIILVNIIGNFIIPYSSKLCETNSKSENKKAKPIKNTETKPIKNTETKPKNLIYLHIN